MTTPPPEPEHTTEFLEIVAWYVDGTNNFSQLERLIKAYGAAEYKRGTEALQAVTAERDALKADAERYRFIHTRPEWLGWDEDFDHRDIDAIVDRAMKGTS